MCGIAGSVNIPVTRRMLQTIGHRGPDSMGLTEASVGDNTVFFGQTRLAIVDLSEAGFQPMSDPSGRFTILLNGEIYNHEDLRRGLGDISFRGHSDTETVLHFLIRNGVGGFAKLNGIFAIAFLDRLECKLYLARDPYGVKPLYFHQYGGRLSFGSEVRVISEMIGSTGISQECLYAYLRLRFCPSPLTLFEGIRKLEPGHYMEVDLASKALPSRITFYSYRPERGSLISEADALDQYDGLVRSAIKRQLMADVPIAILLSGGVDSALLAYLAIEVSGKSFETYTVGFNMATGANELADAAATARFLGTRHHELLMSGQQFSKSSASLVDVIEEPVGSQSLYPFYHLIEQVHRDGYKVALSGQGVDEGMGGYGRYNFQNCFDRFASPLWRPLKQLEKFIRNDKVRRGLSAIGERDRARRFVESYAFFEPRHLDGLLASGHTFGSDSEDRLVEMLRRRADLYQLGDADGLDYMLILDARLALTDDLLLYTDKLSMRHSMEVRVPFLDLELMAFVESLPGRFKCTISKNKILHKKLAERYLPTEVTRRKKKGFYIPRQEWYRGLPGQVMRAEVESDSSSFSSVFNKSFVLRMFDDHREGRYNYEDQLYSIMNLFYWMRSK